MPNPACRCGERKDIYRTYRLAVKIVLRQLRSGAPPLRIYRCPRDAGWHLTKQRKREDG